MATFVGAMPGVSHGGSYTNTPAANTLTTLASTPCVSQCTAAGATMPPMPTQPVTHCCSKASQDPAGISAVHHL